MKRTKHKISKSKAHDKVVHLDDARKSREAYNTQQSDRKPGAEGTAHSSSKASSKSKKWQKIRRKVIASVLIILAIVLLCSAIFNMTDLLKEKSKLKAENQTLTQTLKDKKQELNSADDPEYIEDQARRLLNMVYPDEIIYITQEEDEK